MSRKTIAIAVTALMGFAESKPNVISSATDCIRTQVAKDDTVSQQKANEVLRRCQALLGSWSRNSVASHAKKPFDPSDVSMVRNYQQHQKALHRYWMKALSTEYADANGDYD
jgi:hypothetical protein